MPLFEFNTGGDAGNIGTTFRVSFVDNGATFTISTTGNPNTGPFGFDNDVRYTPGANGGTGDLNITDTGLGTMTFDVNVAGGPGNFAGTGPGNSITLSYDSVVSTLNVTFVHATNTALNQVFTITNSADGGRIQFAAGSNEYSQILFTSASANGYFIELTRLDAAITCFLTGTGIATPTGSVAVETLQPGDQILTADGGTTNVKWLGIQPVDTRMTTPSKVNPVCIMADAIAPGVPNRDLFVSPDHAVKIGGLLYNANALINGTSIYRVAQMPLDGFTYYHIDTGLHELVLAENCPAETFLDINGRGAFINGHEAADTPVIEEMLVPRISTNRLVSKSVIAGLSDRAEALGLTALRKVA